MRVFPTYGKILSTFKKLRKDQFSRKDDKELSSTLDVLILLFTEIPEDRDEYIEYYCRRARPLAGMRFPVDMERERRLAEISFDRAVIRDQCRIRQLAALIESKSRKKDLKHLDIPTLVLHGSDDPLILVEDGIKTAKTIPNAKLKIIEGLGHELPPGAWPELMDDIEVHLIGVRGFS